MSHFILERLRPLMVYVRGFIQRLRKPDDHQFFGAVMIIIGVTIIHAVLGNFVGETTTAAFIRNRLHLPLTPYAILMMGCGAYLVASERPRLEVYLLVSLPVLLYVSCVVAASLTYGFPLTGAVVHAGMYCALLRDAGSNVNDPTRTR